MSVPEQFARLFSGRTDIYGLGEGRVVKAPLTLAQYRDHLGGSDVADHRENAVQATGLGVFPLRQDGTVSFAAIDLDRPDFELAHLLADLLPGPAYVERSRSGNAHVWVFFATPVEAWVARAVMLAALEAVGERNVEVFPKQDRLRDEAAFGNYINLPYHGEERPIVHANGEPVSLQDFLAAVEHSGFTPAETWRRRARALGVRAPDERPETAAFGERPTLHECAARIYRDRCERPLVEGHRDVVLFNFAKMVLNWREITVEEARELVDEVNACAEPPLEKMEVDRLFRNAIEKRYTSTGCDDPLMADYVDPNCPILRGAQ